MQNEKLQRYSGGHHELNAKAMPGEALIIHVPDPERNRVIKVNDISETRYGRVLVVGEGTQRHREPPVKVGDMVLLETATAGVGVPGVFFQNKLVHRVVWRSILAVVEDEEKTNE